MAQAQDDIHNFWFGEIPSTEALPDPSHIKMWFMKSDQTDQTIKDKFESLLTQAVEGELDDWKKTAHGSLAFILLCDQFSRNIYRETPKVFATDALALACAEQSIEQGFDAALHPMKRVFFYMPLEHSEILSNQDRAVTLFGNLSESSLETHRKMMENYLSYAHRHRDVIVEFSRFPHRNVILGRESTSAENAYLSKPGSGF